jgi:DNA-binding beta-propeller fold protein YncE
MRHVRVHGLVVGAVAAGVLVAGLAAAGYHVVRRIPLAGDTGWDYITADTEGRRLYVPHGIEVVVLDLDTGATVGKIAGEKGLHGVVVARDVGRGFISASDPGSVTIFDLQTLAVIEKVRVGDDPNGIIYDPRTRRVFSADRGSKRMTAIDAATGKIVATSVDLDGRTEHLAADGDGHVFLNMQDRGTLLKLDARDLKVLETWPLAGCGQPSSMDIDREHARVFVGCGSGLLAVVDGASGKIVATQPIGRGVDALEFDAAKGLIFVSTGGGEGVLSIFHQDGPNAYSLVEHVKTLPGARTMALDHKTGMVYLPVADVGEAPAPTADNPRPRARMVPGSFSVLVVGQ